VPFPGPLLPTPRRPDSLSCGFVHQQKVRALLPTTRRRREATLSFSGGKLQHSSAQPGTHEYPHSHLAPLTLGNPEKDKVKPFSRSLVPEPALCMEVSPNISSWYRSTSHTSSGSFPASEVTFHVPRASLCCWRSAPPGPLPGLPPGLHSTRPRCLSLLVEGPQGGCTMLFVRAEPDRALWT